jgi:hypothetical protein
MLAPMTTLTRRWKRRALGLLAVTGLYALHVAWCARADDDEARLAYLARRIDAGDLPGVAPGAPFDGEWQLVVLSASVVAATNLAFRTAAQRASHAPQVERWTRLMASEPVRQFDTLRWGGHDALAELERADGHAGYLGHLLVGLGASCLLGRPVEPSLHARLTEALARRLGGAPSGLIETYPGETYVPDNVVVAAGLALADRCAGTHAHQALLDRWVATLRRTRLDPATDLPTFAPHQLSRGSAGAWNTLYLPFVDEAFARGQQAALTAHFEARLPFGAVAVREFPLGAEGSGDVDSGPLVFGLSPSATGCALAGASLEADHARRLGLLITAETTGVTVGWSERRYLLGPLVGDAVVLAARTATPWGRRRAPSRVTSGRGW